MKSSGSNTTACAPERQARLNLYTTWAVDLGGYYLPKPELAAKAMRPSETLNGILAGV